MNTQAKAQKLNKRPKLTLQTAALRALPPPVPAEAQLGLNKSTPTKFFERNVFKDKAHTIFRDGFLVFVFQALPSHAYPAPGQLDYLPSGTEEFKAAWVPRFQVSKLPMTSGMASMDISESREDAACILLCIYIWLYYGLQACCFSEVFHHFEKPAA